MGRSGMTKIRLKYIQYFADEYGERHYFRRRGFKTRSLPGGPGSAEFMAAYAEALAECKAIEIGAKRSAPNSLDAVIAAYMKDDAFTKVLALETQRMRRNILDRFRTNHGGKSILTLERRHIVAMLEKKKPFAQKNWLKTLRGLMLFAVK